jgi:hypothetical protein
MPKTTRPERDDIALDEQGRPLPHSPAEVRKIVRQMADEGEVLAVIVRVENDLAVKVFGPPSQELAEALRTVANSYTTFLKGH